jgi:hypothetical protein
MSVWLIQKNNFSTLTKGIVSSPSLWPPLEKDIGREMSRSEQRNANAQAASMDNMGNRDEPNRTLCAHVLKERWERGFIQNNQDPYKEEIKIPPPHPHKRKNINYFSTQRIHIFSALQNDNVVNVFILNKENMTDLHVYTCIHTYTR